MRHRQGSPDYAATLTRRPCSPPTYPESTPTRPTGRAASATSRTSSRSYPAGIRIHPAIRQDPHPRRGGPAARQEQPAPRCRQPHGPGLGPARRSYLRDGRHRSHRGLPDWTSRPGRRAGRPVLGCPPSLRAGPATLQHRPHHHPTTPAQIGTGPTVGCGTGRIWSPKKTITGFSLARRQHP